MFVLAFLAVELRSASLFAAPIDVVQEFVEADGRGDRLRSGTWRRVARLVEWQAEPAWDAVLLVAGVETVSLRNEGDAAQVEVRYTVVGEVRAGFHNTFERIDARRLLLVFDDLTRSWRIAGPPLLPHVYSSNVDIDEFRSSFAPEGGAFLTNSAHVWRTLRKKNRAIPYVDTFTLPKAPYLEAIDEPRDGDVVVFLNGEMPYHCGIVRGDGLVESATMNGGVRVGPPEAFPGSVRLFRMRKGWKAGERDGTPTAGATSAPTSESTGSPGP